VLVSHKKFIIEYFNEGNMSNEKIIEMAIKCFSIFVNGTCHPI
jgi:hypothetical protein